MDEAETLCNEIGILAHGKMRCVGSALHLRATKGEGYRLQLAFEADDVDVVEAFIAAAFPTAQAVAKYRTTMEYRLPAKGISIAAVFKMLEEKARSAQVSDWSISQLGLDDVFQAVVRATAHEGKADTEI